MTIDSIILVAYQPEKLMRNDLLHFWLKMIAHICQQFHWYIEVMLQSIDTVVLLVMSCDIMWRFCRPGIPHW